MTEQGGLTGVSRTALGVAYIRARESERRDRLFDDPHAQAFVNAAAGWLPASRAQGTTSAVGMAFSWHVAIRTRFYDDYLASAARAGCRQVVLLAAGLDTRAFRMDWPAGTTLFEVDLPEMIDFKEQVLEEARPRCTRIVVAADLREAWPQRLVEHGFDPAVPTAWLAEGLLVYLALEEATGLVQGITSLSAAGSRLSFETGGFGRGTFERAAEAMPRLHEYTSLWKGGLGRQAPEILAAQGWTVERRDAATVTESYGRPVPEDAGGGYLVAERV